MKDSELDELFGDIKAAVGPLDSVQDKDSSENRPKELSKNIGPSAFPTQMSCNQVFDLLLKCYSIGGQVRHYYRYGEVAYCQEKKDQLKFCMTTKLMSSENKEKAISEWYMKQLAEQKARHQTSEEVWNARQEPLRRPFQE